MELSCILVRKQLRDAERRKAGRQNSSKARLKREASSRLVGKIQQTEGSVRISIISFLDNMMTVWVS